MPAMRNRLKEARTEQGNYGHRHEVGSKERNHNGKGQCTEQELTDAVKKGHWEKHHDRGQGRSEDGQANLIATYLGSLHGGGAHLQMAIDILERDDGVVDDARKGQRQAAENHRVHGAAAQVKDHKRSQRGERDGENDGGRSAKASEKDQNHQAGKEQADEALVQQSLDSLFHEGRLVKDDGGLQLLWDVEQVADGITYAIHHLNGVGVASLLHDGQVDRTLAIDAHHVVLNLIGIFGLADIISGYPRIALGLNGNLPQMVQVADEAVRVDVIVEGADLHVAGRQDEIEVVDCVYSIHGAQLPGGQLVGIDVHHDLAVLSPERRRNLRAFYDGNLVADGKLPDVVKLRLGEILAFQRDQADGKTGSVEFQYDRGQGSGRQALEIGKSQVGEFRDIGVGAGSGLEVHTNDADTEQRPRLHVIDAAGQGEETLQGIGNGGFNVLRRHSRVERGHHHFRQIDCGEQIHRHARQAGDANHHQHETDHDNEIWITDGKT